MTAPQNGPQEGQQGTGNGQQGSGDSSGSSGAGGQGNGQQGAEQQQQPRRSYADVLADLDDDTRAVVLAEMAKKNGEARNQRQRAKDAEAALARLGNGPREGEQGTGNGEQGNGSQQQQQQQQPREGEQRQPDTQIANARAAVARSKVEAIAATAGFADPEDAVMLLGDLGSYVDTDFSVDADSIRTDVDALLSKKPHLRRAEGSQGAQRPGRPAPDRSQGSSANGSGGQRTGIDAGADLYRQRHSRSSAGASS